MIDSIEASPGGTTRQHEGRLEHLAATVVSGSLHYGKGLHRSRSSPGLLAASWLAVYLAGGAAHVAPHWFYIPILLAAACFGFRGAAVTGIAAGLLAGPLVPADVALGIAQKPPDEISRAIFFLVIGLLMAAIIGRLKTALSREVALLGEERDLAARKAAVVSTVSHEFRTPLTVILGTAETLHDQQLPAEERQELLEGVQHAARKLDNLVSGVLAVIEDSGSGTRTNTRLVSVGSILEQACSDLARSWGDRVHFGRGGSVLIWADPAIVEPALRAVIENALKFSPASSQVSVIAVRRPKEVEITIQDMGPGISNEFLPHAFEPFTQADPSTTREHGSLGIGLFVARTLVSSAGGSVELRSGPPGGVVAGIRLPGARADIEPSSARSEWWDLSRDARRSEEAVRTS